MTQNGSYIDFIHDIYLALFSCRLRRSSDNDSVYQFVAHFTGKFGRFEVFFDVPYKLIRALYCVFRFCKFCFYFCDVSFQLFLLVGVFLYKADADIFGHFSFYPVFVSDLHKTG